MRRRLQRGAASRRGSLLIEVSLGLGVASVLALMLMRASLLSLGGGQWTIMQTLTDACLTREAALANRVPVADLLDVDSLWPDAEEDEPPHSEQTITLGRVAGGTEVTATLIRFRVNESPVLDDETAIGIWRLHSILAYQIGGKSYVKSRTTLRTQ